jgi:hypothetical protein
MITNMETLSMDNPGYPSSCVGVRRASSCSARFGRLRIERSGRSPSVGGDLGRLHPVGGRILFTQFGKSIGNHREVGGSACDTIAHRALQSNAWIMELYAWWRDRATGAMKLVISGLPGSVHGMCGHNALLSALRWPRRRPSSLLVCDVELDIQWTSQMRIGHRE